MKTPRRLLAAALAAALLPIQSLAWTAHPQDLSDVEVTFDESVDPAKQKNEPSAWAKAEVDAAIAANLVPQLTGNPKYTAQITREQFAELVYNMVVLTSGDVPDVLDAKAFTDCANPSVTGASAFGIVDGVGEGKFAPTQATNREQIAVMVSRSLDSLKKLTKFDLAPTAADISKFTDQGQVSPWAVSGMGALASNGIMSGTSATTLSPKSSCTVEQAILLCYRVYEKFKQVSGWEI